jgi:SAM-dependent methyltransferase
LHEQRFALPASSPLPSSYTVVSCAACGACYADTAAPEQAYKQHYEQFSKYDDVALGTGGGTTVLDRERLAQMAALIAGLPLPLGKASRILDVGCAGGGLLQTLKALGFEALTGMDPSASCVGRVQRQGFECYQGTLLNAGPAMHGGAYDLVVLSHVVEHLLDVPAAIRAAGRLLVERGLCYVEVPDASRYSADDFVPYYFFDCEHINHFDRPALSNLGRVSGFEVVAEGTKNLHVDGERLYPAAWALLRKSGTALPAVRNTTLRTSLAAYIERSTALSEDGPLAELADSQKPVLLWGAGQHAQRLLQNSALARCNLIGIVDRDASKHGRQLLGHTIAAPEQGLLDLQADVVIVVASVLHGQQIAASIVEAGMSNRVVVAR